VRAITIRNKDNCNAFLLEIAGPEEKGKDWGLYPRLSTKVHHQGRDFKKTGKAGVLGKEKKITR